MSEFYFDYECVSMAGNGQSSLRALDFYLFQNYDPAGAMTVQVHIPAELQKKYCGARLYTSTYGVEVPDDLDNKNYQYIPCKDDGNDNPYLISDDNCIFLQGDSGEISGTGVIAFIEGKKENPPLLENMYKYSINFVRKDIISYRILEKEQSMQIQVVYNVLRKDTTLLLIKKTGSKPIMVGDCTPEHCVTVDGEPVCIVLKASLGKNNRFADTFRVDHIKGDDFRLIFKNPEYNEYYMLVDDSDFTIEDRKDRKHAINSRERARLDKVKRCPYCGDAIVPCKSARKGSIITCDGRRLELAVADNFKGRVTMVCGKNLEEESKGNLDVKYPIIPENYFRKPSVNIVTVGFPSSGKTIFLSSLINMKGKGNEMRTSNSHIFSKIAEAYGSKKDLSVVQIPYYNVEVNNNTASLSDRYEMIRSSRDNILKRYSMSVGEMVEGHTPLALADKLAWNPVGFKIGSLGHAYFYDVPGEVFTTAYSGNLHCFDVADCFIAVMDGDKNPKDAVENLANALAKLTVLSGKRSNLSEVPIAVVFTKHDKRLVEYIGNERTGIENCFDTNCHVTVEDMTSLIYSSRHYENSELELHIERSSYELEHFLKSGDADTVNKYQNLKREYHNIKFFSCSALGKSNSLGEAVNQSKMVLYKPRRLRLELPIIWLMYQKGLIPR